MTMKILKRCMAGLIAACLCAAIYINAVTAQKNYDLSGAIMVSTITESE